MPQRPHHSGRRSVACCQQENIGHFQPHNNFPAQSLHFRSGSVFPCPTLKSGVTASTPRTQYGRLVRPYPVRFSHSISSAYQYKQMWYPARKGKSAMLISQLAPNNSSYHTRGLLCNRGPQCFGTAVPASFTMESAGTAPRRLTRGYTVVRRPTTAPGFSTVPQPISA